MVRARDRSRWAARIEYGGDGTRRLRRGRILGLTGDSQAVFSRSSRLPDIAQTDTGVVPVGARAALSNSTVASERRST